MTTKNEYKRRKDEGLCLQCGKMPLPNKTMCLICIEKIAEKYKQQKENKKCINCNSLATRGTRCDDCADKQKELSAIRRKNKKLKNECLGCKCPSEKSYCDQCLEKLKIERDERRKLNLCLSCGDKKDTTRSRCKKCIDTNKKSVEKLKSDVFDAYGGPFCKCCGETIREFLVIDHINDDGAKHRKEVGTIGVYYWLRRNNFPPGFQVYCQNCNWGKRVCGICPHQLKKGKKKNE